MADIFISYKKEDKEKAQLMAEVLEERGWSVWWDPRIRAGEVFDEVIEEALDAAKCVVVLWSNLSTKSRWVRTEANEGMIRDILVPVLIEMVVQPLAFRMVQAVDLSGWKGDKENKIFTMLFDSVATVAGLPEKAMLDKSSAATPPKKYNPSVSTDELPENFTNSIGMHFVLVPPGIFMMGGDETPDEKPRHEIHIQLPYYLQTTQVTQGQWERVMADNPSHFQDCGKDCPVETVSWNDAKTFLAKINRQEEIAKQNKDWKYRLPTEAEWEYAARSGGKDHTFSGGADLDELAWYRENSNKRTHPVGQKKANELGLYDMTGNVLEWVEDDLANYGSDSRSGYAVMFMPRGKYRIVRGGGYMAPVPNCRTRYRNIRSPHEVGDNIGFRVAFSVDNET